MPLNLGLIFMQEYRFEPLPRSLIKPYTLLWASISKATNNYWACGYQKMKALSFGLVF